MTCLIGTGVSPGLTNMMAAWGARQLKGEVSIECEYATFRPVNPTEGLLETALRQFRNGVKAPIFDDYKLSYLPPFSGAVAGLPVRAGRPAGRVIASRHRLLPRS